jgi:hypothetical protein
MAVLAFSQIVEEERKEVAANDGEYEPFPTGIENPCSHCARSGKRVALHHSSTPASQEDNDEDSVDEAKHSVVDGEKGNQEKLDPVACDSSGNRGFEVSGHLGIFPRAASGLACRLNLTGGREHFQGVENTDHNVLKPI